MVTCNSRLVMMAQDDENVKIHVDCNVAPAHSLTHRAHMIYKTDTGEVDVFISWQERRTI